MAETDVEKQTVAEPSTQDVSSISSSVEQAIAVAKTTPPAKPYSAFPDRRRTFMLCIVTLAGFFGPLSGGIYLPALEVLGKDFRVSDAHINGTVSVFMAVFAIGVSCLNPKTASFGK